MTRRIAAAEKWWRARLHREGPDTLRATIEEARAEVRSAYHDARWQTLNRLRSLEQAARTLDRCEVCNGTGWVRIPDSFLDGATADQRCPACQDFSVRSQRLEDHE